MRITTKTKVAIVGLAFCLFVATPVFSQSLPKDDFKDLQKALNGFTDNMAKSLPFNATMGLNWSPAHIGQFLGIPPHFGVGLTLGFTTMEGDSLDKLLGQFSLDLPFDLGGFPLLGYTVEGRIGGFILPFDVGVKFGYLPITEDKNIPSSIDMDYLVVGADLRYRILEDKLLLPGISFGIGYNYLRGGIGQTIGKKQEFSYMDEYNNPITLTLGAPKVGISWETSTIDFKLQVSKSFIIVTPYAGVGASVGLSKAGYTITSKITDEHGNQLANPAEVKQALSKYGVKGFTEKGFESFNTFDDVWSFRAFGGISLNLALIRIDLTGLINFGDGNYGITLGTRFQL